MLAAAYSTLACHLAWHQCARCNSHLDGNSSALMRQGQAAARLSARTDASHGLEWLANA